MILAAPLVIPFAKALGLSVGVLGVAALSDKVNQFIQDNPEESMKILSTIIPGAGIGQIFMNKEEKISLEDLDGMSDEEAQDLSKEDKAELMKQAGKSGSKDKRQTMIDISEKLGLSGEGKDKQDIEYEIDERYDEGGVEEVSKPKFDYKKFFRNRKADGGSIGIEVLFEEKKPRKDFSIGGQARPTDRVYDPRANVEDFTKALKSVSAGTTYQQQRQAQDYARQDASRRLSEAMRSGNQANIQGILQGVGGITSIPGMQFNRSGNRVTSVPATGPGRDKIINAMAQQMLNYTPSYQSLKPQPRDNLGLLMQDTIITDQMKSPAEMEAIRQKVLAAQKAQEQSYFMTDPVTGKKYSSEAEAIDDLGLVTYNQRFADGGRVGLFMGGDPLTGQALAIYNSMNAYGFSDQEIANALEGQGLYTPGSTPVVEEPVTNTVQNIINQGGGDGPPGPAPTGTKTYGKTFTGMTMPDGTPIGSSGVVEGVGIIDGLKNAATGLFDLYQKFSPIGIISNFMKQRAEKQKEIQNNAIEKARKEREMQEAIAEAERKEKERAAQYGATNYGKGVGGQSYSGDAVGAPGLGFGVGATTGGPVSNRTGRGRQDYSKGGLATMFKEKR